MIQQLLQNSSTILPVAGLLFFVTVFAAVVIRTTSRKRRAHYEHMANLPLENSEEVVR